MVFDPGTSGLGETQIVLVDEEVTFLKYFQYTQVLKPLVDNLTKANVKLL